MIKTKNKVSTILRVFGSYLLLIVCSFIIIFPFYIIFITSLKSNMEAMTVPITYWPQNGFHFDGYVKVLHLDILGISFLQSFGNTLLYVIPPTFIGLFVSSMCAYAYTMINFPGKKLMFSALLFSMMIPGTVTMIPSFLIFETLGWVNTPLPLMIPGMFGGVANVFFMQQYFKGLPKELVEAARIDGLRHFSIFTNIIIPLSKPALISLALLGFIGGYNDYFGPMLYLHDADKYTLQIALQFTNSAMTYDNQTIMAGCIITMLPMLVIYFFAQNFFVKGIAMSGLKA